MWISTNPGLPLISGVFLPGPTPGQWLADTGSEAARVAAAEAGGYPAEFDLHTYFLHDVPPAVAEGAAHERPEADIAFGQPWAAERLGCEVVEIPGGHLAALSHPAELTEVLLRGAPSTNGTLGQTY